MLVAKFLEGRPVQTGQPFESGQEPLPYLDGILTPDANAQQDGEQFGVLERLRAEFFQAFARTLVHGEVGDAINRSRFGFGHRSPSQDGCPILQRNSPVRLLDIPHPLR